MAQENPTSLKSLLGLGEVSAAPATMCLSAGLAQGFFTLLMAELSKTGDSLLLVTIVYP